MTDILITQPDPQTGIMDIMTEGGDLAAGISDYQHQALILISQKGEWKQHPELGAEIEDMALDHDFNAIRSEVIRQFENDGMRVSSVKLTHNGLVTETHCK